MEKSDGKRPRGRPGPKWQGTIKTGLQDVGCGGMDWIEEAQNRDRMRALLNAVINSRAA